MRNWCVALAAALGLCAGAAEAEPLQPSGGWNLSKAADNCELSRSFGRGGQAVTISLVSFAPNGGLRVAFIGSPANYLGSAVTLQVGDAQPTESGFDSGRDAKGVPSLLMHRLISPAMPPAAHTLTLTKGAQPPLVLEAEALPMAVASLRACSEQLVKDWGLDPERLRRLTRRATPIDQPNWLHDEDFPRDRAYFGLSSTLYVRLLVDADGKVSDCHALMVANQTAFDQTTCKALRIRAHFDPALDAARQPVASYYLYTIRYEYQQ